MKTEAISINYHNQILRGFLDLPEEVTKDKMDVALQLHGMCGQCDSSIDLALSRYFTSQGMAVVRINFLAHGNSDGDFFKVTIPDQVLQAKEMLAYAKALPFAGKIIVVGHSMGAAVATLLVGEQEEDIDAMILLAPASVIERLCQTGDFGDFTFDPAYPPERVEIPGTRFRFSREYLVTGKYMDIMGHAARYHKPVCIIHGDKDAFLPMKEIRRFSQGFSNCTFYELENASHFFNGCKDRMVEKVDLFMKSLEKEAHMK